MKMPIQGGMHPCLRVVDITRPTLAYEGRSAIYFPIVKKATPDIYREELAWIQRLPECLFEVVMDHGVRDTSYILCICTEFLTPVNYRSLTAT